MDTTIGSRAGTTKPGEHLFSEYAASRDPQLRARIVEEHLGLVRAAAAPFVGVGGLRSDDLVSFGAEGLLSALERFDPRRGFKFSTFAVFHIRGSIIKGINEELRSVRGLPKNERVLSLDAPAAGTQNPDQVALVDICADAAAKDPQLEVERDHLRLQIAQIVSRLPSDERQVIAMRFGLTSEGPMGLAEVAEGLDSSVRQVLKIESRALARVETEMRRVSSGA